MRVPRLVPSNQDPTGYALLRDMAKESRSLHAAVAFVTASGVDLVANLLTQHPQLRLEVVARGGPITEPSALIRLAELGASVSVVVGPRAPLFHPKLWLGRSDRGLHVLAGSGNLTAGGMQNNDEQFDYIWLTRDMAREIEQQEQRFLAFANLALPLSQVVSTSFWREWQSQVEARRALATKQRELDRRLEATADASLTHERLYVDLVTLYERTKAEVRIAAPGGGDRPYIASRFKQAIDRGHREGTLVPVVARIVRAPTEGLEHLAEAGRPDLMVESTVLDESKPYHHLFSEKTKTHARATLSAYYRGRVSGPEASARGSAEQPLELTGLSGGDVEE